MIELPSLLRVSLLGAGLVTAFTFAACSADEDATDPTGTGGAIQGTGGGVSTGGSSQSGGSTASGGSAMASGGGSGACIPKTGEYPFCSPVGCTCPPDVSGADLTTPVSFRADIYPMMPASCGESTLCHHASQTSGYAFGTAEAPLSDEEISALIAQFQEPSPVGGIPNVKPGDWQGSYLMMKLDGCQNHSNLNCNSEAPGLAASACTIECDSIFCPPLPCGDAMPPSTDEDNLTGNFPLSEEMRNKVRAWIAQGAPDN